MSSRRRRWQGLARRDGRPPAIILTVRGALVGTTLLAIVLTGCSGGQEGESSPNDGKVVVERKSAASKEPERRVKTADPKIGSGLGQQFGEGLGRQFGAGDGKAPAPFEVGGGTEDEKSGEEKGSGDRTQGPK